MAGLRGSAWFPVPQQPAFHRVQTGGTGEGPVEQKEDVDIAGDTSQEEVDLKEEREQREQQKVGQGDE